jgi:hypothetical protein
LTDALATGGGEAKRAFEAINQPQFSRETQERIGRSDDLGNWDSQESANQIQR